MAGTLLQTKEMFRSIDPENTGVIPRDELKTLMQEIGGDLWGGDNFASLLEACGVEPGSGDVRYDAFLEQLLGGEEVLSDRADAEASAGAELSALGAPSAQDWADAEALVVTVCEDAMATVNQRRMSVNMLKQRPSLLPLSAELAIFGDELGDKSSEAVPAQVETLSEAIAEDLDKWIANETRSMRLRGELLPLTISSRQGELLFEVLLRDGETVSAKVNKAEFDSLCPHDSSPAAVDSCISEILEKVLAASEAAASA